MRPHPHPRILSSLALTLASLALAAVASAQTSMDWWAFPGGGDTQRTTGIYTLSASIGAPAAAALTGGVYSVNAGVWVLPAGGVLGAPTADALPATFEFAPLSPNPFATSTMIAFALPVRGHVTAEVFDVKGERVCTLVNGARDAGRYRETWRGLDTHGRAVSAGVYFVRVRAAGRELTRRIVRLD
jgi:hypothetical protein